MAEELQNELRGDESILSLDFKKINFLEFKNFITNRGELFNGGTVESFLTYEELQYIYDLYTSRNPAVCNLLNNSDLIPDDPAHPLNRRIALRLAEYLTGFRYSKVNFLDRINGLYFLLSGTRGLEIPTNLIIGVNIRNKTITKISLPSYSNLIIKNRRPPSAIEKIKFREKKEIITLNNDQYKNLLMDIIQQRLRFIARVRIL